MTTPINLGSSPTPPTPTPEPPGLQLPPAARELLAGMWTDLPEFVYGILLLLLAFAAGRLSTRWKARKRAARVSEARKRSAREKILVASKYMSLLSLVAVAAGIALMSRSIHRASQPDPEPTATATSRPTRVPAATSTPTGVATAASAPTSTPSPAATATAQPSLSPSPSGTADPTATTAAGESQVRLISPAPDAEVSGLVRFEWDGPELADGQVFGLRICQGVDCLPQFGVANPQGASYAYCFPEVGRFSWAVAVIDDRTKTEVGRASDTWPLVVLGGCDTPEVPAGNDNR